MSIRSDGGNNWLQFDDTVGPGFVFSYNSPYTVCMWFKPENAGLNLFQYFLYTYDSNFGSTYDSLAHADSGSGTSSNFEIETSKPGSSAGKNGTTVLSNNVWYHVAFRRTSVTTVQGLLNGVQEMTDSTVDVTARTNDDTMLLFGDNTHVGSLLGSITQFRIWTTNLSDPEIKTEMMSPFTVRYTSLWGDYPLKFNDDFTDYSGNGRHLTLHGTLGQGINDPPNIAYGIKKYFFMFSPASIIEGGGTAIFRMGKRLWG